MTYTQTELAIINAIIARKEAQLKDAAAKRYAQS